MAFHLRFNRLSLLLCALAVSLFGLTSLAAAQQTAPDRATLTGTVVDAETGDPLPNANVIIANSMQGTATNADGGFRLSNVPLGAQRLHVSMVGYESASRNLNLRESGVQTIDFALEPTVVEGEGVVVEAERDEQWQERFERFQRLFIGETPNAGETKILNPEVLSFSESGRTFETFAAEPLEIENQALGYRVTYFLDEFQATRNRTRWDGEPLFEEMEGTPQERQTWAEERRQAFLGSFHHLMLALFSDRVDGQGFKLFKRPRSGMSEAGNSPFAPPQELGSQRFPTEREDIIEPSDADGEIVLDFDGMVEVVYLGAVESDAYHEWRAQFRRDAGMQIGDRYQTSQFWLERGPATVDYKGDVVDPYGVTRSGYYAFKRIADQVPKEYRP